jgi:glycosyltransferase involved in cell wall biosynthesis
MSPQLQPSMENREPLVSIGIPVYNGERYLRQALDSVLEQSYKNLEIVISDNASTDRTRDICLEYAARDDRIRYTRNSVNIGLTANLRRVLALSAGEYFLWAAADDLRPSTAVQSLLGPLRKNERAVMCHGPVFLKLLGRDDLDQTTNEMDLSDSKAGNRIRTYTHKLTSQCIIYGLFRRNALERTVFPNTYGQEYLFCLQLLLLGPFEYVTAPMVVYSTRRTVPHDNPMYPDIPFTLFDLLTDGGMRRFKCWTVLLVGCYFLLKISGIGLYHRFRAAIAHVLAFVCKYRRKLSQEILFQLFLPVSWITCSIWSIAAQSRLSSHVARKLKTILLRT